MANDLKVTLDKNTTPWLVDIDQKNNANHVARSAQPQTITWQLNGNAASGKFISLAWVDSPPITPPPAGIFGAPQIAQNGNSMTMTDLNNSNNTAGDWFYILTIEVGGQNYQSGATSISGTSTNPSIKNN